jgi:hypothetical protein
MTIKTFSDGAALPASDINEYLTNAGLVYIKSQTVGSGVSSVTVSSAFSSTYDNYKIIYSGGGGSGGIYLTLQLGSTTTNYFGSMFGSAYSGGAFIGIGVNSAANFPYAGLASTNYATMSVELYGPNLAKSTNFSAGWTFNLTSTGYSMFIGEEASTTQHTAFTIGTSSGTISGGTVTVYGYRKA